MKDIRAFAKEVAEKFHPERIVLFGSYGYGRPRPDSDVDLLIVLRFRGRGVRKAVEILEATNPRIAVDLVVRTPREVQRRLRWNDFFLREVLSRGKVLYESHRS